ncbi:MAG TPA: cytochrome c family protein [Acidobacteriota bacterium]|nr:cytochrome c family protein [Acidobacteriota bacterium]
MKRLLFVLVAVAVLSMVVAAQAADHKYIGAAACKMCHKAQFDVWAGTAHAKAMETLKGEAAAKAATAKGLKVPASEAPECLKCHQTAFGADAALLDAKFDKAQGVQCESCHGAGGDYKAIATMKDKAKAVAAGLTVYSVADGSAEKFCVKCHNSESPTFKEFKFAESWDKIKHPKPAAK